MKILPVVIAHGNGIAAFRRHEKYWLMHKEELLVICPENDPLHSKHETIKMFKAEHSGKNAGSRLRALLTEISRRDWDHCVIYEYDSFLIKPELAEGRGLNGILFSNSESPRFAAPIYANPPWHFDRWTFERMMEASDKLPRMTEGGVADRYFSALAYFSNVPLFDYEPNGFSRGTIGTGDISAIRTAIYDGCYAVHGVKQEWVLKAIEQFYDESNPSG